jgi:hypothetical protein
MSIDPKIRHMARERVARDCAERGVPVKIQNPTIYTALAKLIRQPVSGQNEQSAPERRE